MAEIGPNAQGLETSAGAVVWPSGYQPRILVKPQSKILSVRDRTDLRRFAEENDPPAPVWGTYNWIGLQKLDRASKITAPSRAICCHDATAVQRA